MIRKGDPKSSLVAKWMSLLDLAFGGGALPGSEDASSTFPWQGPDGRKYDGVPGEEFEKVTKRWQGHADLPQTGEVGPAEWAVMYAVRHAKDPDAALLDFLQSTYEAAAELAGWDRAGLECPEGRRAVPRPVD